MKKLENCERELLYLYLKRRKLQEILFKSQHEKVIRRTLIAGFFYLTKKT